MAVSLMFPKYAPIVNAVKGATDNIFTLLLYVFTPLTYNRTVAPSEVIPKCVAVLGIVGVVNVDGAPVVISKM